MNNTRRDEIKKIQLYIDMALANLGEAKSILEDQKAEEEETFSSASEGKQNGDWGQESQAATDAMQTLIDAIEAIDLSDEMDELGRCIERDLEAPKGRLTKAQVEERARARLPNWVVEELARLESAKNEAEEKAKAKFKPWEKGSKKPAFHSYVDDTINMMECPTNDIIFPQVGIRVTYDEYWKSIELHGVEMGSLVVRGNSSNVMYARLDERF